MDQEQKKILEKTRDDGRLAKIANAKLQEKKHREDEDLQRWNECWTVMPEEA